MQVPQAKVDLVVLLIYMLLLVLDILKLALDTPLSSQELRQLELHVSLLALHTKKKLHTDGPMFGTKNFIFS